jgi:D-lactate dehydrogenase
MARALSNEAATGLTPHQALTASLAQVLPADRIITDPLGRLAHGTDASFYRLEPQVVAVVEDEAEMVALLRLCRRHGTPVTFRAAGTSLSGQAVTDSVLAVLGDGWNRVAIAPDALTIRLGPGVLGGEANRRLAPFGRKIGPDPASISACKVGGIAANNASGMCCGTAQNSYRTLQSMRVMLADGTLVDTGDAASRAALRASHPELLDGLARLRAEVLADEALAARIRRKFAIKNTTGYSLNALVDFTDPVDILAHLMIGSEGTLGFIAEITYRTVPEHADKATGLLVFEDLVAACEAVIRLKPTPVAAVELIDRAGLRSVEGQPGMPPFIRTLPEGATALLVETRAADAEALARGIDTVTAALAGARTLLPVCFSTDPGECERLWTIRKGLFPSVAAMREIGTPVIIEDIAVPIDRLADATRDLQRLFRAHGFDDTFIFGHALEGNLHFVITPDLSRPAEIERYRRFMDAVARLVVDDYDGSLKAEHGTGRNMAPFVELEWGADAYRLMRRIKDLFDPEGLLNPGVILNDDKEIHLKNIKPMPAADRLVDACMECGFCERTCPSAGLTLTPRQRIAGWREISRLAATGEDARRAELIQRYAYQGLDTCAACGLCASACPIGIETGLLTKKLRGEGQGPVARRLGELVAGRYGTAMGIVRQGFRLADLAASAIGPGNLERATETLRRLSGDVLPAWSRTLPAGRGFGAGMAAEAADAGDADDRPAVVYLPSCAARAMGPAAGDPDPTPLPAKTLHLLAKAGYRVVLPDGLDGLCCGQPFESKGLVTAAARQARAVEDALARASDGGRLPIVSDTSPCSFRLKQVLPAALRPLDIVEFIHDRLMDRLAFTRQPGAVALHVTCSGRRMGLEGKLAAIGRACAESAVIPASVGCCGFAGDKGFHTPELNAHALRSLADDLPDGCTGGYSHSRTCEIGLSQHAGVPYRSIVYLVDACSRPKAAAEPATAPAAAPAPA